VRIAARVVTRRDASKKLTFFDLVSGGSRIQVVASKKRFAAGDFDDINRALRPNDSSVATAFSTCGV
jgi:lysyl-tRNA synthetase class II